MSKIHLEIFDKDRQKVFSLLGEFKKEGYLAGGTALSLQINHRKSFDFDIFLNNPVSMRLRLAVQKIFDEPEVMLSTEDQLSVRTKNSIGITFLWYPFSLLSPFIKTNHLSLASITDITADKAYTIGRRAVWRDYADMFYLLSHKFVKLADIIEKTKKKFKGTFNESLFLEQLVYFNDLEVAPIEWVSETFSEETIKSYLEETVQNALSQKLR